MTKLHKLFISLLVLMYPVFMLAQETHLETKQPMRFWDFIFTPKYIVMFLLTIIFVVFLFTKKIDSKIRVYILAFSFILFGVVSYFVHSLFISPSPVCATTKPFYMGARPQFFATIAVIGVLSVLASKGFCGIVCPIGALQEIIYKIPVLKNLKRKKLPFYISNSIRIGIAILFFILVLSTGFSIYGYINMFDLIHWEFTELQIFDFVSLVLFLIIMLGLSLFLFRPFCYLICPMGILTWILEHFSVLKVRLRKEDCNKCGKCIVQSPCSSVREIIEEKTIRGDCHLCNICIESCPTSALFFGIKK